MTEGTDAIAAERQRQIAEEGYDAAHDRAHEHQLMAAAMCYLTAAAHPHQSDMQRPPVSWPWAARYWKPEAGRRRNLAKAGALIAATLDSWAAADAEIARPLVGVPDRPQSTQVRAEETLRELAEHGLRFDLNPTMAITTADDVYAQWAAYARRMDDSVRAQARAALAVTDHTDGDRND